MSTKKIQILGGMNANTLGGKTADEFASAVDLEQLSNLVGDIAVSEQVQLAIEASHNNFTEVSKTDIEALFI